MAEENKECLKIVKDFYRDVLTVFPEYKDKLENYEIEFLMEDKHGEKLYEYCLETYPQHFFNILGYFRKYLPNFIKIFMKIIQNRDQKGAGSVTPSVTPCQPPAALEFCDFLATVDGIVIATLC